MTELSFVHRFERGARPESRPLLILHGTGGNEHDLIPLGKMVAPGAPLLSPRGKVLEHGMPRFFRRLAEGVFDEEDVRARTHELADFIEAARKAYGIAVPVAFGYSNGANIAAAVMLLRPEALAGGILLRAMVPLAKAQAAAGLGGKAALIISYFMHLRYERHSLAWTLMPAMVFVIVMMFVVFPDSLRLLHMRP